MQQTDKAQTAALTAKAILAAQGRAAKLVADALRGADKLISEYYWAEQPGVTSSAAAIKAAYADGGQGAADAIALEAVLSAARVWLDDVEAEQDGDADGIALCAAARSALEVVS